MKKESVQKSLSGAIVAPLCFFAAGSAKKLSCLMPGAGLLRWVQGIGPKMIEKKRPFLMAMALLFLTLSICGTGLAAEYTVDSSKTTNAGQGIFQTLEDLRKAVNTWNNNDKIKIMGDDSSLTQAIDFGGKQVIISGYGIVSPQTGKVIQFATGGGITLVADGGKMLTLTGFEKNTTDASATASGGAINSSGAVTITGSAFTGNSASPTADVIADVTATATATGGAVYSTDAVTIRDSAFINNIFVSTAKATAKATATATGSAVYSTGAATITDSAFTGNSASASATADHATIAYA
ncbi:hypothetical protein LJC24_05660, partial [Desulfococcaceae bacterium OttesenSCG-928-F15]|nr:hypothetical protein [Desulfococcaceae bacterium OttesenSCG-928-F15]